MVTNFFSTNKQVNFALLKYVKFQRSYGFLITEEVIFGFQILDLKDVFNERVILADLEMSLIHSI